MRLVSIGLLFVTLTGVHAADLVTRSGKVYHDYRIIAHDAGFVTILDSDGGSRVPLADLPDSLQQQYGYDPAKAAAFVSQFNAADRQERAAVVAAETSAVSTPTDGSAPEAVGDETASTSLPPATNTDSSSQTEETKSSSFDSGYDPLSSSAQVLHSENDSSVQTSEMAVDSDGAWWVSSIDPEGMVRWYRYGRRSDASSADDRHAQRLDGARDIPDGAVVTNDRSGRLIITYVDSEGHLHRDSRAADDWHLAEGAWRIQVDENGRRVATRDSEEDRPHDLRFVQGPSSLGSDHPFSSASSSGTPNPYPNSSLARPGPSSSAGISHPSSSAASHPSGSTTRPYPAPPTPPTSAIQR